MKPLTSLKNWMIYQSVSSYSVRCSRCALQCHHRTIIVRTMDRLSSCSLEASNKTFRALVQNLLEISFPTILKTNYGSWTVIPLYITGCREKIYSESAVVAKRRRLIRVIYFLPTAGDIKRYHRQRTVISLVSGFFLTLYTCREIQLTLMINL